MKRKSQCRPSSLAFPFLEIPRPPSDHACALGCALWSSPSMPCPFPLLALFQLGPFWKGFFLALNFFSHYDGSSFSSCPVSLAEDKEEDGSPTELLLGAGGCPIMGLTLLPQLSSLLTNLPLILSFQQTVQYLRLKNLNWGRKSTWILVLHLAGFCFFFYNCILEPLFIHQYNSSHRELVQKLLSCKFVEVVCFPTVLSFLTHKVDALDFMFLFNSDRPSRKWRWVPCLRIGRLHIKRVPSPS